MQSPPPTTTKDLKELHSDILSKLHRLSNLNEEFKQNQEKQFMSTLLSVMDQLSNQLVQAKNKYQQIDKQIDEQPICKQFYQKLEFFKSQSYALKEQLQEIQDNIEDEKDLHEKLSKQKKELELSLFAKSKDVMKYQNKMKRMIQTQKNLGANGCDATINSFNKSNKTMLLPSAKRFSLSQSKRQPFVSYFSKEKKAESKGKKSLSNAPDCSDFDLQVRSHRQSKVHSGRRNYLPISNKIQWSIDKQPHA